MKPLSESEHCLRTTFDPFDQTQVDDPFPIWRQARESEPVFFSDVLNSWVVTGHGLVQQVLEDAQTFKSGGLATISVIPPEVQAILDEIPSEPPLRATDPPDHTRLRRPTQAVVNPRRVSGIEDGIRTHAHELIDQAIDRDPDDFYGSFGYVFPLAVIGNLLGFPHDAHRQLHEWANSRQAMAWGRMELDVWTSAARDVVDFYRYVEGHLVDRMSNPRDDGLTDVITTNREAGSPLSTPEMVEMVQGLITAGHESTAAWLTMSVFHMLEDRSRWQTLCAHPDLIPKIAEETLRLDNPVRGLWRSATAEALVGDVTIAPGDRVYAVTGATNRDAAKFVEPDSFVVGRSDSRAMMTFGRGPHMCLGSGLARLEGRVALQVLAERVPDLRLVDGTDRLSFVRTATLRIPTALPVHWR